MVEYSLDSGEDVSDANIETNSDESRPQGGSTEPTISMMDGAVI